MGSHAVTSLTLGIVSRLYWYVERGPPKSTPVPNASRTAGSAVLQRPPRPERENLPIDGAPRRVRAGKVPDAHQESPHDLAAGEAERALEELHPLGLRARVVRVEPPGEGAVRGAQLEDRRGVRDGGVHLEPVAD